MAPLLSNSSSRASLMIILCECLFTSLCITFQKPSHWFSKSFQQSFLIDCSFVQPICQHVPSVNPKQTSHLTYAMCSLNVLSTLWSRMLPQVSYSLLLQLLFQWVMIVTMIIDLDNVFKLFGSSVQLCVRACDSPCEFHGIYKAAQFSSVSWTCHSLFVSWIDCVSHWLLLLDMFEFSKAIGQL